MIGGIFQSWLVLRRTNPRFSGLLLQTCECASRHCRGKTFVSPQETEPRVQKPPFNARDGESPFITYIYNVMFWWCPNNEITVIHPLVYHHFPITYIIIHHYTSLYIIIHIHATIPRVFFLQMVPPPALLRQIRQVSPVGSSRWCIAWRSWKQRCSWPRWADAAPAVATGRVPYMAIGFFLAMLVSCGGFFWDKLRFRLIDISVGWDYTTYNWKLDQFRRVYKVQLATIRG